MRILIGEAWRAGFLDEHRAPGAIRIDVRALAPCRELDDLYYVRERSLRRLWNGLREVGPVWLARKVASRWKEGDRNSKVLSVGLGVVREADPGASLRAGAAVVFIAPCHPAAQERIVLPDAFASALGAPLPPALSGASVLVSEALRGAPGPWDPFAGWSAHSGIALEGGALREALRAAERALGGVDWAAARTLPAGTAESPVERDGSPGPDPRPSAVLFGFGHYGRTIVLSNVRRALRVAAVHEIDPVLLGTRREAAVRWDTSPEPRPDERYDAYLIASYHHTHAPLAVHALRSGAACLVEKPLATDRGQLAELLGAMGTGGGRLFAGFHKRYSPLNALARTDLLSGGPAPIHYHAIVYEEPLPQRHWYRWPNSRSRMVSNGCHWLDHFLFLNDWAEPVGLEVASGGPDGEIANVSVRLANGAFFSMALGDAGSRRIGVRDYIELRSGEVTVTIENGSRYLAEDGRRIVRRATLNKMTAYETMYRTIADLIHRGAPGDSARSVQVSGELTLAAEEAFQSRRSPEASLDPRWRR